MAQAGGSEVETGAPSVRAPVERYGRCHYCTGSPSWTWRKRGTQNQAIGKSKGGWTTKILALTDALGNLVRFNLLPGHRYDTVGVVPLIEGIEFEAVLAYKAYDANWIIENMQGRGAQIVISQRRQRKNPLEIDEEITNGAISSRISFASSRNSRPLP